MNVLVHFILLNSQKNFIDDYIIKSKGISTRSGGDSRIQGIPRYALRFRLGLLETEAAAVFLPLAALLKQVDTLETLQNVALRRDLAGTSKTAMLTHDFFSFSKKCLRIIPNAAFQRKCQFFNAKTTSNRHSHQNAAHQG
jgi:hypothetical protein